MLVVALVLPACGADGSGEPAAFCAAYERLRDEDPFERLDVASPGEVQAALAGIQEGADRVADRAPDDAEVQADRFVAALEGLVDQLRAAGYDLRALDLPDYRRATDAYYDAAVSLERAAAATCG